MARQLRAEQTRATIITAAADLFDRHGYESTSLSDIVEHAHVTKGALYFHFAAKEDLAHAIMEIQSRTSRQMARDIDARGYTSLEALIRITFGITRLSVEGPIARAGLRLATGGVAVRPPLRHPFTEWLGPGLRETASARSRSPTSIRTSMSTRWRTPWSASSSAAAWSAARWSRWRASPAGWRTCGTSPSGRWCRCRGGRGI